MNYSQGQNNEIGVRIENEFDKQSKNIKEDDNTKLTIHYDTTPTTKEKRGIVNINFKKIKNKDGYTISINDKINSTHFKYTKDLLDKENFDIDIPEVVLNEDATITTNFPFKHFNNAKTLYFATDLRDGDSVSGNTDPKKIVVSETVKKTSNGRNKHQYDCLSITDFNNLGKMFLTLGGQEGAKIKFKNNFSTIWGSCGAQGLYPLYGNNNLNLYRGFSATCFSNQIDLDRYYDLEKPLIPANCTITVPTIFCGKKIEHLGSIRLNTSQNKIKNFIVPKGIRLGYAYKYDDGDWATRIVIFNNETRIENLIVHDRHSYTRCLYESQIDNFILELDKDDASYGYTFAEEFAAYGEFKKLILGDTLISFGNYSFFCNNISELNNKNIKYIGDCAFYSNEITTLEIEPKKVYTCRCFALNPMTTLKLILTNEQKTSGFVWDVGSVNNDELGFCFQECSLTNIENLEYASQINVPGLFSSNTDLDIDFSQYNFLNKIGNAVFYSCGIKSINSNTLRDIGAESFMSNNNLLEINCINLNTIGRGAFNSCVNLENVILSNYIQTIPAYAFYGDAKLKINSSLNQVKSIGDYAFYNCNELSIDSLNMVTDIGRSAFQGTYKTFTANKFPNLQNVGRAAFAGGDSGDEKDYSIELPNGVKTIPLDIVDGTYCKSFSALGAEKVTGEESDSSTNTFGGRYSQLQILNLPKVKTLEKSDVLPYGFSFRGNSLQEIYLDDLENYYIFNSESTSRRTCKYESIFQNLRVLYAPKTVNFARPYSDRILWRQHPIERFRLDKTWFYKLIGEFSSCSNLREFKIGGILNGSLNFTNCPQLEEIIMDGSGECSYTLQECESLTKFEIHNNIPSENLGDLVNNITINLVRQLPNLNTMHLETRLPINITGAELVNVDLARKLYYYDFEGHIITAYIKYDNYDIVLGTLQEDLIIETESLIKTLTLNLTTEQTDYFDVYINTPIEEKVTIKQRVNHINITEEIGDFTLSNFAHSLVFTDIINNLTINTMTSENTIPSIQGNNVNRIVTIDYPIGEYNFNNVNTLIFKHDNDCNLIANDIRNVQGFFNLNSLKTFQTISHNNELDSVSIETSKIYNDYQAFMALPTEQRQQYLNAARKIFLISKNLKGFIHYGDIFVTEKWEGSTDNLKPTYTYTSSTREEHVDENISDASDLFVTKHVNHVYLPEPYYTNLSTTLQEYDVLYCLYKVSSDYEHTWYIDEEGQHYAFLKSYTGTYQYKRGDHTFTNTMDSFIKLYNEDTLNTRLNQNLI